MTQCWREGGEKVGGRNLHSSGTWDTRLMIQEGKEGVTRLRQVEHKMVGQIGGKKKKKKAFYWVRLKLGEVGRVWCSVVGEGRGGGL